MSGSTTRSKYTEEFKQEALRQVMAGASMASVAQSLGIPKGSLRNWLTQLRQGRAEGENSSGTTASVSSDQMEIARLRAEVAQLRMERDIAKKAAAYFAQDTLQSTPGFKK